jgi:hypothetical protein
MTKSAVVNIRLEPSLKADLEKLAAADNRTLSGYIELLLRQHVKKKTK